MKAVLKAVLSPTGIALIVTFGFFLSGARGEAEHPRQAEFRSAVDRYRAANERGEITGATKHAKDALALAVVVFGAEHPTTAAMYGLVGTLEYSAGNFDLAVQNYETQLRLLQKKWGVDFRQADSIFNNLGVAYTAAGDVHRALEHFQKAHAVANKHLGAQNPALATYLNNIAESFRRLGEFPQAMEHYGRSIEITVRHYGSSHANTGIAYNNLGLAYLNMGLHKGALNHLERARGILESTLGNRHQVTASCYLNICGAQHELGQQDDAAVHCEKALSVYTTHHPHLKANQGAILAKLASVRRKQKRSGEADRLYRQAIALLERNLAVEATIGARLDYAGFKREGAQLKDSVEQYNRVIELIMEHRMRIGRHKSAFTARFVHVFDLLVQTELLLNNTEEAFRADMRKRGLSIAEGLSLQQALASGSVPVQKQETLLSTSNRIESLRALHAAQVNGARAAEAEKTLDEIWKQERARETLMKSLFADYPRFAALLHPRMPGTAELRKSLHPGEVIVSYSLSERDSVAFVVQREHGLKMVRLKAGAPSSKALKPVEAVLQGTLGSRIKNLHTIASAGTNLCPCRLVRLNDGDVVIWNRALQADLYSLDRDPSGREKSDVGASVFALRRSGGANVRGRVGTIVEELDDGKQLGPVLDKLRASLHRDAVAPVLELAGRATRLIIVPDGMAYYLPFGILTDSRGKMLLETHDLKLAHSPAVWLRLRNASPARPKLPLLALGNPVYAQGHETASGTRGARRSAAGAEPGRVTRLESLRWSNLAGTDAEVRVISEIAYADPGTRETHSLRGVRANRDALLRLDQERKLADYRVLHFAVHGLFVDGNVELNALVLTLPDQARRFAATDYTAYSKKNGDLSGDGYLRLGEIKSLTLQSDLVVMSACETSLGHETGGEGMVGLPQAFLLAGSRNVMASLWSVDDEATNHLMQAFYRNLLQKKLPPAPALHRAQLETRQQYASPYYWGAFVTYGD